MNTISQSVLCTNYVQVPVTIWSPSGYNPSGDVVQFSFTALSYPTIEPVTWYAGSLAYIRRPVLLGSGAGRPG